MKTKMYLAAAAMAFLFAGAGLAQAARGDDHQQEYQSLQSAKLTLGEAAVKAEEHFPGVRVVSGEFETEDGKPAYTLEVMDAKGEKEVTVDAISGQVLADADKETGNDNDSN